MGHSGVTVPLSLFVVAVAVGLAIVAWRNRSRPGALPFSGLMIAIAYFAGVTPLWLFVLHSGPGPLLLVVSNLTMVIVMPVLWVLFVLEYAGYSRFLNRYSLAGLVALPLLFLLVLWTPFRQTIMVGSDHPIRTLFVLYMFGYTVVGIFLLFRFIVSERRLYTDQSVALVVGIAAPFAGAILSSSLDNVDFVLTGFAVTGLAFGFALFRFDLFTLLPVTRRLGRDNAIEDLGEGVFIVDPDDTVVDLNRSGASIVGRSRGELLGERFRPVLGEQAPDDGRFAPPTFETDDGRFAPPTFETDDGRTYDVSVSPMHDRRERVVGHTVVFRDITDRELRENQLEVLNRVLRHNLRNTLSAVQGYAELLADGNPDHREDLLERHMAATAELIELGERAREFERLKTRDRITPMPVSIATLVDSLVDDLTEEFPDAELSVALPGDPAIETYPDALEIALQNLLRNAAEHNDQATPSIAITATDGSGSGSVEIAISDDGPGIPDHELSVLEADAETALDHGSGLGLWITTWAVQYLGGDLTFEENDPRGTTARVTIPKKADDPSTTSAESSTSG